MIWRLTYCNKKGVEARIDIIRGIRTPVEIVQGSGQPFTLAYKLDKNDKSGHIMTSSADIEIFETATFNIDDLKTSNETELKVEYFEDNVLTWSGFILPDFFSREIGSPNIVRMTASDRLTALKGVTLSDLPSRVSLRNLIELCLQQTGLSLGLVSQIQINQGSTNILDSEVLSQRLTDVRGRSISCYDILMSIMVGTNSTIRQRAGQWQVYNKLEHELRTPTISFDKVERGAIRTIQPVASSVGVYQEHGGGRIHPENYDFSDNLAGWNPVGGFNGSINNKEILGYYQTYNIIYGEETDKSYLVNSNNFTTSRYIETDAFAVPYEEGKIIVKAEINATGPRVQRGLGAAKIRFALIAEKNGALLSLNDSGAFVAGEHIQEREFSTGSPLDLIAVTMNIEVSGVLMSPAGYSVRLRFYGSNVGVDGDVTRVTAIDSAIVSFDPEAGTPKGNLYKTTQGSNYTKLHDVETVIFGDYIRKGLNGYFYDYPIDDTSNLYLPSGTLSTPQWITAFDTTERPLLHHISRQKSSLFSVAHDILKANINVESFDPLAVFQDCKGGKYVVVSARFDFLRSEVDVELEQIAYDNTISKRDFIYSYFGEGEDTIKSIGGVAGGGGGTGGDGMTSDQITILNEVAELAHLHENKEIIDQITQDMVDNASHEIVISTDTETELTDENILSALRVLSEITKNNETFLEDLKEQFLSKINPDTAQKLITFVEGLEIGDYTTGALGAGAAIKMIEGTSFAEVDNLTVRQKATFRELIIESLKHIGGQLVLTPARMKCVRVVDGGSFYKCYFDTGDGEVSNEFVAGDFARCQVFTGSGTKFYWRLVTLVGEDWINLSKTTAAVGSDAPEAGDDITQLGNATDTTRQSAIILSTVGIDAPSWKQYSGINSFSLEGKETTVFSKLGNRIQGETVFTSGGANLDNYLDGVAQDILDALQAAQDADDKAQQAIEDAEADVAIINTELGRLQDQIDGKVSNWYYAYTPTLSNYPASDWTTNEIKDSHIGDTFTNTEPAPAENAGKSWRFVKDGSTYSWTVISDSDALKALQEASKAQATADGKSTTYLFQPTKYKLGDMWVLNDDQTINGTLYKQGELLTATQDSETFHEAHWLKRVRYTDDTKIDNLEIGGRNYFLKTSDIPVTKSWSDWYTLGHEAQSIKGIEPGVGYTVSAYIHELLIDDNPATDSQGVALLIAQHDENGVFMSYNYNANVLANKGKLFVTRVFDEGTDSIRVAFRANTKDTLKTVTYSQLKLEKGNKATDWTPAPEDVEANIETAKTEAENAAQEYADIKSEAERVLAEAYADGIVSDEEQARIDDVNDKLALAKAHAEAQDALLKTQQEAYADGKISTAEQAAIQAAKDYADLKKTEAQAYADGIVSDEEARAIADALDKYNASKAYAEQLVNDIEIGGRNLLRDSGVEVSNGAYRIARYDLTDEIKEGEEVTLTIWGGLAATKSYFRAYNSGGIISVATLIDNGDGTYSSTFEWRIGGSTNTYLDIYAFTDAQTGISAINKIKLEKGNKATDWTPAPEDVEASIATAKADAENAQSTANSLKDFTDTAFRDGITNRSESIAIEKYKNSLNEAMSKAEASYDKVFKNTYLPEGAAKTSLLNAKINLWGQRDTLLSAINTAISGGTTTPAQKTAVDNAFSTFNNLMTAFQNALEEANKAIQTKLDDLSTEKVDNIEIGGRNLLLNSTFSQGLKNWETTSGATSTIAGNELILSNTLNGSYPRVYYSSYVQIVEGENYSISFEYKMSEEDNKENMSLSISDISGTNLITAGQTLQFSTEWVRFKLSFKALRDSTEDTKIQFWINSHQSTVVNTRYVRKFKLEKGNKATDWTPAPEDVDAAIDNIEIGGRNLIPNSNNPFLLGGETDTVLKYRDASTLKFIMPGGTSIRTKIRVEAGEIYTFSAMVYSSIDRGNGTAVPLHFHVRNESESSNDFYTILKNEQSLVKDTWKLVYVTIKITTGGTKFVPIVYTIGFPAGQLNIAGFKLEKGNKATDWTPAPEDVQAAIDAEKTRINDILSDNIADPSEKQYLSNLWQEIYVEYPQIRAQANDYSVSKTTYEQKYTALKNILDPVLANLTINSTVSGSSIRTAFSQYYDARTVLQNAITNKVNTAAADADAKAQALEYLKLAIGQDTEINGALVTLVTMLLKQDMNADVTAGISGLQGAAKNLPAFWAGGTDVQAQQGTAKAIIRHDGTAKFTDAEITGIINALTGEIGNFDIQDGELKSAYSVSKAIWDYSKFPAEYVGERTVSGEVMVSVDAVELNEAYTYQGIPSTTFTRITPDGVKVKSTRGLFFITEANLVDGRLSIENTNTQAGVTSKVEIFSDGIYFDGVKFTGEGGGSDYTHPATHTASMITAGTLQGIVKANNNTSYTTKQVRNMILSTGDAVSSQMANGDIWIKYE